MDKMKTYSVYIRPDNKFYIKIAARNLKELILRIAKEEQITDDVFYRIINLMEMNDISVVEWYNLFVDQTIQSIIIRYNDNISFILPLKEK